MTNERKRLNPENKNREKHNNIFGNLEGSVDDYKTTTNWADRIFAMSQKP